MSSNDGDGTPSEPGAQEGADYFFEDGARRWTWPQDLRGWVVWGGIGITLVAACQFLASITTSVTLARAEPAFASSIRAPTGYYSITLLGGLLLTLLMRDGRDAPGSRLVAVIGLVGTATGMALVLTQTFGAADQVFNFFGVPRTGALPPSRLITASRLGVAFSGIGDAVFSGIAVAVAAVVLLRSRTTPSVPDQPRTSKGIRPNAKLLGAGLTGALIFAAYLIAAHVGNSVSNPNTFGLNPSGSTFTAVSPLPSGVPTPPRVPTASPVPTPLP